MSTAPQLGPIAAEPIPDDAYVLPEALTEGAPARGPRFADEVWDLRPFVPRTQRQTACYFADLDDVTQRTLREFLYSRIRRGPAADGSGRSVGRPLKITSLSSTAFRIKSALRTLRQVGANRLSEVTAEHLQDALMIWMAKSPNLAQTYVNELKHLAAHGPFLSQDRLLILPWPGRSATAVAGIRRSRENVTDRIPEEVSSPLIKAAVFYVQHAGKDLLAARHEVQALHVARAGFPRRGHGRTEALIRSFIAERRASGRGIPALNIEHAHTCPDAAIVDRVVQRPNNSMIGLLVGAFMMGKRYRDLLRQAGDELGYEPGGLDTSMSIWPDTGRPWRTWLDPWTLRLELTYLRTACWIVIAFLSGARDVEIRELQRDCAFVDTADDGRPRYKLRGRVFKGRKLTGDEAEWVVLDVVHQAVDILLELNDDPTHLFGHLKGDNAGYRLLGAVNLKLARFRDHVNDLFSPPGDQFIPNTPVTQDTDDLADSADARPPDGLAWTFNTRQFRRTLAWHIAHQPFGIVAGARQFHHTKTIMFEGYAGTSASGFAAEVAAEEAVANLDYLEDLYRDWNDGGRSSGGAARRIDAEFDRIRRELGDLPGVVASPSRLRTMLQHLTKILHPGTLNDCFFQSSTAVCAKRAKPLGRPLPMINMCSACPNSRRTALHLPRLVTARDQARDALDAPAELPPLQQIALTDYVTGFDQLIAELHEDGASCL
ncbi:hypothetical protein [Nonomuraea guangzhouensis]|uniref:Integrase n=1 Tax=Nonomuraea guangzhouensis TaxID=1291555 RepID=A0ABW4GBM6_9ACTN|nr:hypothetical protein [Nonomuraea guangzhouensis]